MNTTSRTLRNTNFRPRVAFKPWSVTYLAIGLFFVVGLFYIVIVNRVATKGTEVRIKELEKRELNTEYQQLMLEADRLRTFKVIEEGATGQIQPGDKETTTSSDEEKAAELKLKQQQSVTVKPKLVQSAKMTYLPSYGQALANK